MTHQEIVSIVIVGMLAVPTVVAYFVISFIESLPVEEHDGRQWQRKRKQ